MQIHVQLIAQRGIEGAVSACQPSQPGIHACVAIRAHVDTCELVAAYVLVNVALSNGREPRRGMYSTVCLRQLALTALQLINVHDILVCKVGSHVLVQTDAVDANIPASRWV
jgi:hypothetical protein